MWVSSLLLLVGQSAALPVATSIEPTSVAPYRPVELTIRGEGFEAGCRVLIGPPGRLVPVRSEVQEGSVIRARLTAGLSPHPPSRHVVVDCGPGRRSGALTLTIVVAAEEEESGAPATGAVLEPVIGGSDGATSDAAPDIAPRLVSLDPPTAPAGEPFTLTLKGASFHEGARVVILANGNAGTSLRPEYRPVPFPAEVASDTVLLVDFDRGFAASPKLRSVIVVNPDGGRSPPLYLGITRSLP